MTCIGVFLSQRKITKLLRPRCLTHQLWGNHIDCRQAERLPYNNRARAQRLDVTRGEGCLALLHFVRRNHELVAVGIAEINRVRDFVILEFEFDSVFL